MLRTVEADSCVTINRIVTNCQSVREEETEWRTGWRGDARKQSEDEIRGKCIQK